MKLAVALCTIVALAPLSFEAEAKTPLRRYIRQRVRPGLSSTANCRIMSPRSFIFHADTSCNNDTTTCFDKERNQAHDPWKSGVHSLWGTESEEQAYLYLRLDHSKINQTQYADMFQFQARKEIPLLNTARSSSEGEGSGNAYADGIKALFSELGDEAVDVNLFWSDVTIFDGPKIEKGSTMTCTKKNVLRLAFGVQGGLSKALIKSGCAKEPELTPEQLQDFSVKRFSRTDIDDAFVKIACDHGFKGYFSPSLPKPSENSPIWNDHKAHFGKDFVASSTMDSEAFVCDAGISNLADYEKIRMEWNGQTHQWARADGGNAVKNSFSDIKPCSAQG